MPRLSLMTLLFIIVSFFTVYNHGQTSNKKEVNKMFALFKTNKGDFKAELFNTKVPKTVENFVGLAEGTKEFSNPKSGQKEKKKFYDGLIFHRVIKDFMIQGGCPLGTGTGGPGYRFADEFDKTLRHDKAGVLSMANAGANTNGSQFFITVKPQRHLDDKHSIFGQVVEGMDVVEAISTVETGPQNRPVTPIEIKSITILRQ